MGNVLSVVILAAGQGKRMYSTLPKVLHPIAGKAMLRHVVDAAEKLQPGLLCIVYGHGGEQVQTAMAEVKAEWALQAQQLGTGHAVRQALPVLPAQAIEAFMRLPDWVAPVWARHVPHSPRGPPSAA
jgi:bifunctional UDP-N-acetylglucosamine pyrophosphorylase/glucosamine-1-phosphate N-acetyltransferase